MPSWLPAVLALLGAIYHAESPALKAAALEQLKKIAAAESAHPALVALIDMAEAAIAAAPESLPV
jgi:hypothetical protein